MSGSDANEIARAHTWARAALLGDAVTETPLPVGITVARQDAGEPQRRQSVRLTPLKIGSKSYERGLGVHANSELVVRLDRPGRSFSAHVGVDNNWDTNGQHGTVVFSVVLGGKEVFNSGLHKGGQEPANVSVALDGAREFVLRVSDAGDGFSWDQSDWSDAKVSLDGGGEAWLDEMPFHVAPARLSTRFPLSFLYDGQPAGKLLPTWKRTVGKATKEAGKERRSVTYSDPATGLEIRCDVTLFDAYPAVEWIVWFKNTGKADTPILESIRSLDVGIGSPPGGEVVLHYANGSTCGATDFLPVDSVLEPGKEIALAPNGGRSSDGVLPFFNLEWSGGGLVGAIGWSGQWALRVKRESAGELLLEAGQQTTHLRLHPGESIRTPRMLAIVWQGGDRMRGHNLLRRLILEQYAPKVDGKLATPMIGEVAVNENLNMCTEENQLAQIPRIAMTGAEMYWLDAGWFEGGWPNGAGSWTPKSEFPRGLRPLGNKAHENGLKFILWFEPERARPESAIAKQHPDFVRWGAGQEWGGLFKLDDPAARRWLTDYLAARLEEWGVDVYRNDFNIDPLRFWQAADSPDRQGITENHYVEGLYEMWDELRRRKPGLTIDNCASGGRRIDLETLSRSYPLWRSDTTCAAPVSSAWDQCQTAGLSFYVPFHSAQAWSYDAYAFRSVATTAVMLPNEIWRKDYPIPLAKRRTDEIKALRPLWLGDYYPLLPISLDDSLWCGWQFDRPDLGQGFAMLFRRPKSRYASVEVALSGVDGKARYAVEFVDEKRTVTMTGAQLAKLNVAIPSQPGCSLIRYRKK